MTCMQKGNNTKINTVIFREFPKNMLIQFII